MAGKEQVAEKPKLLRKLTLLDSVFLVMGGVIGSGIFMTTGFIADFLPSPWIILLVWILGGFITLSGALSFAELGAMFPRAGGQFVYLKEAYGPWAGFLFGWAFFWVIECGGIAALAVGLAEYGSYFFPFISTRSVVFKLEGLPYSISAGQLAAVASILFLSAVNAVGIRSGAFVQNLFMWLRLGAVAALITFGIFVGKISGIQSTGQFFSGGSGWDLKAFGLALFAVLWTYDGWYSVSCTAEEVKNPARNIPLGLLIGTLGVTLIYLLTNFVYILALPVERMRGVARIGELAAQELFGPRATFFLAAAVSISIFGCLSATILYGPRVFYAMAEEKIFFRSMSYVHPRYHVPSKAIFWQAVWSSLLCLSGTYQALYEYVVFALVLFFAATGLAVVILRIRQPGIERPYRTWGYPVIPFLFVVINLAIFLNSIISQPFESLLGLALILAGIPAFFYWRKKART